MAGDETETAVMSPVKELEEELGRVIKVSTTFVMNISFFLLDLLSPLSAGTLLVRLQEGHLFQLFHMRFGGT